MQADFIFVLGLVIGVLAAPALVSSFTHNRSPRGAAALALVGGALIAYAAINKPGGYPADEIPAVVGSVIKDLIN